MPPFEYKAIKSDGSEITGYRDAKKIEDVEFWLLDQGMHPVHIKVGDETNQKKDVGRFFNKYLSKYQKKVSLDQRILFCRQLATMLNAGVAILDALQIMSRQATNPQVSNFLADVSDRIEEGANLSDSFAEYPQFVSPLFVNIIKVGEETGTLDLSFQYLAELYENEKEINERIKAATRYPQIVVSALIAAILFLMSFVVPKFINMFNSAKVELPLPTKILIVISDFTTSYIWGILFFIILLIFAYRFAMGNKHYRTIRDRLWLQVPILGELSLKIFMARFAKVFSVLQRSGVNVIRTLELSATALENMVLLDILEQVTNEVRGGVELNKALERHSLFPDMIVQMVAIGEQAGQVDAMMEKVADYYEKETNYIIRNLSTLIEPMLLVVMGLMVGFLALAIYMPMWDMIKVVR